MSQFYFKINLNKDGELLQQAENEKKQFIVVVILTLIVLIAGVGFSFFNRAVLNKKLNSRKKLLKKLEKELANMQESGSYLTKKDIERYASYSLNRIFWTNKLQALSAKTSDKIAITSFSFKGNKLILNGITKVDKKEKELDLVLDFVETLKADPRISQDFPSIGIESSRRDKAEDVSIIRFKIGCNKVDKEG